MATTHKFKVTVRLATGTIYPIVEASTSSEAQKIARAQYPNGQIGMAVKV